MQLATGARVGPYEVLAPIGAGGMGEVYRARDIRLGREVALKIISDGAVLDPERLQRFEQEARLAGSLNHPNLGEGHSGRPLTARVGYGWFWICGKESPVNSRGSLPRRNIEGSRNIIQRFVRPSRTLRQPAMNRPGRPLRLSGRRALSVGRSSAAPCTSH